MVKQTLDAPAKTTRIVTWTFIPTATLFHRLPVVKSSLFVCPVQKSFTSISQL